MEADKHNKPGFNSRREAPPGTRSWFQPTRRFHEPENRASAVTRCRDEQYSEDGVRVQLLEICGEK